MAGGYVAALWHAGLTGVLFATAAAPLITIAHELAHTAVAFAVRRPPRVIWLFGGRRRFSFSVRSIVVVVASRPFGGAAVVLSRGEQRGRSAAILLAGPVSDLTIGGSAIAVSRLSNGLLAQALVGIAVAALLSGARNLLPVEGQTPGGVVASDGLRLARLLRQRTSGPQETNGAENAARQDRTQLATDLYLTTIRKNASELARLLEQSQHTGDAAAMLMAASILAGTSPAEARKLALRAIELAPTAGLGALAHREVAWCNLLEGDDALVHEAHAHAYHATTLAPSAHTYSTMGWVMLRLGRSDEAHVWLLEAWRGASRGDNGTRHVIAVGLEYAAIARGDHHVAAAWHRGAGREIGRSSTPPTMPRMVLTFAPPRAWQQRTPIEEQAIGRFLKIGGVDWRLWFTLAAVSIPFPMVAIAARSASGSFVCTTLVGACVVAGVRGRRLEKQTDHARWTRYSSGVGVP